MSTQPFSPIGGMLGMPLTPLGLRPNYPAQGSQAAQPNIVEEAKPAQSVGMRPYVRLNLIGEHNTITYLDTEASTAEEVKYLRAKIGPRAEFYISNYYDPA